MSCKPLWYRYPGQCQAQPAYLEISKEGKIHCDWNGEIGNACPVRVWHNIDMRFPISNELSDDQIEQLIADVQPLADKLLDLTEVDWDGNNHRRKIKGEARDVYDHISHICDDLVPDHVEPCDDESCDHCNFEG